jgi:predicted GH43/DUF377 family glycosyl hydrolase
MKKKGWRSESGQNWRNLLRNYTAYDGINVMGALATSKDLIHFEKHGIITPPVNYQEYESHVNRCNDSKLNPKYHQYYNSRKLD